MNSQNQKMVFFARRNGLRSVILVGTALSGSIALTGPVWAQTSPCASPVTASCTNTGSLSIGLTIPSAANVSSLGNTGSIINSSASSINANPYTGIYSAGSIGTLTNSGLIEGTNTGSNSAYSFGITNYTGETIGELINNAGGIIEGVSSQTGGTGVNNPGNIGALLNGGTIEGVTGGQKPSNGINNGGGKITSLINNKIIDGVSADYSTGISNNSGGLITNLVNNAGGTIESSGSLSGGIAIGNVGMSSIGSLTNSGIIEGMAGTGNAGRGIYNNASTITMLVNNESGTIKATSNNTEAAYGIDNNSNGKITALVNSGTIEGIGSVSYGVANAGMIVTLDNNAGGIITGETDALSLVSGSSLGILNNAGTIMGNIDNTSGQTLTITGGSGSIYGTLTGSNGAPGTMTSTGTGGVVFSAGNLLLDDNITVGSGASVTNSGATLLINDQISQTGANAFALTGGGMEVGDAAHQNAGINSNITLSGTGMLRGYGTITGNVINGGTVDPAGSSGIFHIVGTYQQNSAGTLDVAIDPTLNKAAPVAGIDNSELAVTGTATLGGTLIVNADAPVAGTQYALDQTYDVLTAQSISGDFNSVSLAGPYGRYLSVLHRVNGNVYEISITGYTNPNPHDSSGSGGVGGVGGAGSRLVPGPAFTSARFYGASLYTQNAALFDVLAAPTGTDANYWMHGIGSFGHVPGSTYNYKGFVIGRGFSVTQHLIIGGAVSNVYAHTTGQAGSYADNTSVGAELYGIYTMPKWIVTSTVTVGHLGNRVTRYLPGIGAGKFATNGTYSGVSAQADYHWLNSGRIFVTPYAGLSYLYTNTGSGQETGLNGLFNMDLHYGRVSTSLAQADGGLITGYRAITRYGALTSWVGLGGLGTLGNIHARVKETLSTENADITSQIASVGAFTPAIGVQLAGMNAPWKLAANWQGQFANRTGSQAFTLQGSYKF